MKMKLLLLAISCGSACTSCCKTYQCIDDRTAIVTGEVCASTQSKAHNMCNVDPSSPQTAVVK